MRKYKVLLLNPAPGSKQLYINTLPPLGLLGIAAYLQKNGVPVDVFDLNISDGKKIDLSFYDIIGVSINASNIATSLNLIDSIKKRRPLIKVVLGGPSCISNPGYFMDRASVDAICAGEGEVAFLRYVLQQREGSSKEIPGFYTKKEDGSFIYGGDRAYLSDLDSLPFPALDKVDLKRYRYPVSKEAPVSSIMTSRGCPFSCSFCFHSMGHRWRARSPIHVVDEIEWQVRELGVREICILDDNFSFDLDRAREICDLILHRNIRVKFQLSNGIRADFVDRDLLLRMKSAGVWLLSVAPETGSRKIMDKIGKNLDLEKVKQVVRWCKDMGINTYAFFMAGFPFENKEDLEDTVSLIKELDPDFIQVSRLALYPGTPLYDSGLDGQLKSSFGCEQGVFWGSGSFGASEAGAESLESRIKEIHKAFYLRFSKLISLTRIISLPRLARLFLYSAKSGNI